MSDELDAGSNPASDAPQPASGSTQPAPETTTVDSKPSSSAREAIEKAFAKVGNAQAPTSAERARDEAGRFTAKDGKAPETPPTAPGKPVEPPPAKPPLEVRAAPSGFTKAAQEAWAATHEAVRADTERRIAELTQGMEKYKGDVAAFEPLRRYAEMAQQSGTTLDRALANYVGIEQALHQDPVAAVAQIARNIGIDPRALGAALANLQQMPAMPQPPQQQQRSSEVADLQKRFDEFVTGQRQKEAQTAIDGFASDHPYFDDVADSIAHMLETRFASDLADAYQKAVLLNPEIAAKIAADKAAKDAAGKPPQPDPAQTRQKAALSPTGTPSSGSTPQTRKPAGSAREALQSAFATVGL